MLKSVHMRSISRVTLIPACHTWILVSMRVMSGIEVTFSPSISTMRRTGRRAGAFDAGEQPGPSFPGSRLLRAARSRCCGPRSSTFRSRPARWIVLIG
jgi:hypothetical protein